MRDPYEVLGVKRDASAAEIKSAFRRQAKKLPSDTKHDPEASQRFDELFAAYDILGEKDKRDAFDRGEIDAEGKPRFQGFEAFGAGGGPRGFGRDGDFDDPIDREFTEVDDDIRQAEKPADEPAKTQRPPFLFESLQKPPRHLRWLVWICVLAIGGGALIYFRPANQSAQGLAQTETCGTSGWRTNITLDHSRPELVSTTLRSQNAIGPQTEPRCVDISFACLKEGPYFELRLGSSGARIKEIGSLLVKVANNDVNVRVSGLISDDGNAIRVSEKTVVEVLASVLSESSFAIPLTLADGENAVAQFYSSDLFPAIRPVLLTCKMRFFRSVREGADDADYDRD
jgi:hypothetical protein